MAQNDPIELQVDGEVIENYAGGQTGVTYRQEVSDGPETRAFEPVDDIACQDCGHMVKGWYIGTTTGRTEHLDMLLCVCTGCDAVCYKDPRVKLVSDEGCQPAHPPRKVFVEQSILVDDSVGWVWDEDDAAPRRVLDIVEGHRHHYMLVLGDEDGHYAKSIHFHDSDAEFLVSN